MYPSPMEFIFLLLIAFRLTMLVVKDKGPQDSIAALRAKIGVYYDEYSECKGKNVIASALCCVWCSSIWIALGISSVVYWYQGIIYIVGMTLALSGGVIILDERYG